MVGCLFSSYDFAKEDQKDLFGIKVAKTALFKQMWYCLQGSVLNPLFWSADVHSERGVSIVAETTVQACSACGLGKLVFCGCLLEFSTKLIEWLDLPSTVEAPKISTS